MKANVAHIIYWSHEVRKEGVSIGGLVFRSGNLYRIFLLIVTAW